MASSFPFVESDFEVPEKLETKEFRLRMLTIHDVVKDYDAVMSSIDGLTELEPGSDWPKGLTIEQNLIDLGWHHKEFLSRRSFTYTVISLDETKVLGCVYIYPTRKRGYDTEVLLWAREAKLGSERDAHLFGVVRDWLKSEWPFEQVGFPGREIDWDRWNAISNE